MNLECRNMVGQHKRFSISWTSLWMEVNRVLFWILLLWCTLTKCSFSSLFSACHRVWFSQTCVYFASQGNMHGTVFHILNASTVANFYGNFSEQQTTYLCWMLSMVQVLTLLLLDLPGLLFFSTYTLLVLFWAEIYHQASEELLHYFLLWLSLSTFNF